MTISADLSKRIEIALTKTAAAAELIAALEAASAEVSPVVAPAAQAVFSAGADVVLASPLAVADAPVASTLVDPVDAADLNTALDDKADQASLEAVVALKADQSAVADAIEDVEARLDALETKMISVVSTVNALRAALISAGVLL